MNLEGHHPDPNHEVPPQQQGSLPQGESPDRQEVLKELQHGKEQRDTVDRERLMWQGLGVQDIRAVLGEPKPLEEKLALKHLAHHSYNSPTISDDSVLWYEGSFDPIGIHHFKIFWDTLQLGFKRAVFATVYQNPYKPDSLSYEHRYEMARRVMEKAGLKIVDDFSKEGVCLFPPGHDGQNRFHVGRLEAIYNPKNFILIGPDNFEKAILKNIIWTHVPAVRQSPEAEERYGFRSMYKKIPGFSSKVLVYPWHPKIHSTDIRNGSSPMLGPVADYVREHKLYQVQAPASPSAPPKAAPPVELRPSNVHDSSHVEQEIELNKELLKRLQRGLTGLPVSMQALRDNFQSVLGPADRSQLGELSNTLTKCEDRFIKKPRTDSQYHFDGRKALSAKLLDELSESLIGPHIQVTGGAGLEALIADHQAKIIFVCNESGWGEVPVLTHAFRKLRLASLAESATFVFTQPGVFPTPTIAATVGHGVDTIQPVADMGNRSAEQKRQVYQKALKAGLERLSDGPVVIFPEQPVQNLDAFKLSTIPPLVVAGLRDYVDALQDPDVTPSKIYLVPVGIRGSECMGESSPFSSDDPAVVSFGVPFTVRDFLGTTKDFGSKGDEVGAHILGFRIADLMPEEWQGSYGNEVLALSILEANRRRLSLEALNAARTFVKRGRPQGEQI